MWTPATRKHYSRPALRYQSDVTDEEWRVIIRFHWHDGPLTPERLQAEH